MRLLFFIGRVQELNDLINKLEIGENVSIKTNISFEELKALLSVASVGMHTMANEHFGIGKHTVNFIGDYIGFRLQEVIIDSKWQ